MLHKSFDIIDTKADSDAGTFEATVAVFGNVDLGGDRIVPGAFKKTLAKWAESGDPIPVILSHQWDNPMAHIGVVNEAKEIETGLWVTATAVKIVDACFNFGGGSALYDSSPLQRRMRDMHAGAQHAVVHRKNYELLGAGRMGIEGPPLA